MESALSNICANTLGLGFFPLRTIFVRPIETVIHGKSTTIIKQYYPMRLSQNLFTSRFRLFSLVLLQIPALWTTWCLQFHKVDFRKEVSGIDLMWWTWESSTEIKWGLKLKREPWSDACIGRSSGCRDTATLKFCLRPELIWERGSKAG